MQLMFGLNEVVGVEAVAHTHTHIHMCEYIRRLSPVLFPFKVHVSASKYYI